MKLYNIRGGNKTDLINHSYNIGVGISLGNKWFSSQNIVELIEWALLYSREYVIVYVADSIHAINIEVRGRRSPIKAQSLATTQGEKILSEVQQLVQKTIPTNQQDKIHYARWSDLLSQDYKSKVDYLYKKYESDSQFKKMVLHFIDSFTENENRTFSQEEKLKLGTYLIEELPELLVRVPLKNLLFDAHVYPFDSELLKFIEDIQKGIVFPEIKEEIMDTVPKVFLEVRE